MPRIFAVQLKDEPAERYEQWVNTPVYTHDYEDCVGWLGCELPEGGHSCEFAELAGDGAVTCASSSKVNRLRSENAKLRERVEWLDGECRKRMGASHKFFEMVGEYQKENDKLRELVRDVFEVIEDSRFDPCVERQGKRGPYYEDDPSWRVEIRERMLELGIEVD